MTGNPGHRGRLFNMRESCPLTAKIWERAVQVCRVPSAARAPLSLLIFVLKQLPVPPHHITFQPWEVGGRRADSKRDGETCPAPILSPRLRPTQGCPAPAHWPGLGYVPSPGSREAGQAGTAPAVESRPPALWPLGRPPVPDHVPLPLASAPNPAASLGDLSPASGREVPIPGVVMAWHGTAREHLCGSAHSTAQAG